MEEYSYNLYLIAYKLFSKLTWLLTARLNEAIILVPTEWSQISTSLSMDFDLYPDNYDMNLS